MNTKMIGSEVKRLAYWINERESIRIKRLDGASPPWTKDPILSTYRFCNVRRMDDRVSAWVLWQWLAEHDNRPWKEIVLNASLARHFNRIETLRVIGWQHLSNDFWRDEVLQKLLALSKQQAVFSGAYIINGVGAARTRSGTKIEVVLSHHKGLVWQLPKVKWYSMADAHRWLSQQPGMGSFMAGQVVADLRWTDVLCDAPDAKTFAPLGPGSRRGLTRLLTGKPQGLTIRQNEFVDRWIPQVRRVLEDRVSNKTMLRLEAMDLQNCLCEFDKYSRAALGESKPKRLYRASVAV